MIIIGQDVRYKGRLIRNQGKEGFWIIKDGEYITATTSIKEAKDLIDWVESPSY